MTALRCPVSGEPTHKKFFSPSAEELHVVGIGKKLWQDNGRRQNESTYNEKAYAGDDWFEAWFHDAGKEGTNVNDTDLRRFGGFKVRHFKQKHYGLKAELQPYSRILACWSAPFRAYLPY